MLLMHSFSWHGPLTYTLTGCAERYPMPSSPTLQPQRGVEGNSAAEETVLDKLVDETAVEVEATACAVETPDEGVDKS